MSHVKAGGTSKNNRDSPGQRLGVKVSGGQKVKTGQIIIRQVGLNKRAGVGTSLGKDYTIFANRDGVVNFTKRSVKRFTGASAPRTEVTVI
jgi:large subunit ribosomal protein L27